MAGTPSAAWVRKCSKYIAEARALEAKWFRPDFGAVGGSGEPPPFHDFLSLRGSLEGAQSALERAYKDLNGLRGHFAAGRLQPFDSLARAVGDSAAHAARSLVAVGFALDFLSRDHPPHEKGLRWQRVAVNMAHAHLHLSSPRGIRRAAKNIMKEAGLSEPTDRAISGWIAEENARWGNLTA